ncbi:MAG: pyridine nucleotide-disulfide oxidoreductase [Desulfovibrio sp.]|nr:MAG: pyridine nucleotide-disulfide oxidoreductase [Desulfovibrio sp.]
MNTPLHLVLAGAGHAHLTAMAAIPRFIKAGCRVTVVNPSHLHYYSGMGPGMLAGTYTPEDIRFNVRNMVESRSGTFVEEPVIRVDAGAKKLILASGKEISYDICSFNIGSGVTNAPQADEEQGPEILPVKPIINLLAARDRIKELLARSDPSQAVPGEPAGPTELKQIGVVGGGPAGVEIAGNVQALVASMDRLDTLRQPRGITAPPMPREPRITLFAGSRMLGRFPQKVQELTRQSFRERAIDIVEGARVKEAAKGRVLLDNGREFPCQLVFWASGVSPNPVFTESGLPIGGDGGLLVNEFLQSPEHPELFGGGDCIHFAPLPLDKVGVHAVRQNPLLVENILAHIQGKPLTTYQARNEYLLLFNLGDGTAVMRHKRWITRSRLAMKLKNFIDHRFMRRFQALEQGNKKGGVGTRVPG